MDVGFNLNTEKQEKLLAGCIQGNRMAQNQLYKQFYPGMLAVCMRFAKDREEARDIFHEGFIKVFKNLHNFQPKSSLNSWIRRIMINTAIDHYRKNKKKRAAEVNLEYAATAPFHHHILERLEAEELLELVQQLSPAYRTVFSLYVLEGYSHKQVSAELGISEGTSKSNLAKARAKLKIKIKQLYSDME